MDLLRIKSVENHLRFGKSRATPFTSDAWHVEKHGRIVMKMRQSKKSWNPNQPGFYGMQLMWTPVPHLWQRPTSVQCWHSWNRECYELRHSSNSQWSQVYQNCSGGGFGPVSPSLPLGLRVIPVNAWLSGWNRFVLSCLISTCCLSSLWSILLCSIPTSTWFHLTGSSLSYWCGSIPQQPHGGIDPNGCDDQIDSEKLSAKIHQMLAPCHHLDVSDIVLLESARIELWTRKVLDVMPMPKLKDDEVCFACQDGKEFWWGIMSICDIYENW